MKILPERFEFVAALALWTAAACAACTARAEPQPPETQPPSQASAFSQARSVPGEVSPTSADVEVRGAVARPGRLKLAPGVETLDQALQAAGGLLPEAGAVRVRPGKDPLRKLFAESADRPAEVDLPVAELAGHGVVYLRPGDIVEAVPSEDPAVPLTASEPARTASGGPVPAIAATSSAGGAPTASVAEASPPLPPPHPAAFAAPEQARAAEMLEQAGALAEIRDQLTALRNAMEKRNDVLRTQIEELRGEQARLRASLDQASRSRHVPVPPPAAPQMSPEPAVTPSPAAATAPAGDEAGHSATVIVSGAVAKPGVYAVADVKTVAGAISAAGRRGDADLSAVEIRSKGQGSPLLGIGLGLGGHPGKRIVDLPAVASGKTADVPLGGGEVIFVPAAKGAPVEAAR